MIWRRLGGDCVGLDDPESSWIIWSRASGIADALDHPESRWMS